MSLSHGRIFDTIVMANLGYFQLKAHPGRWDLRLRPGKSADIFNIAEAAGADSWNGEGSPSIGEGACGWVCCV